MYQSNKILKFSSIYPLNYMILTVPDLVCQHKSFHSYTQSVCEQLRTEIVWISHVYLTPAIKKEIEEKRSRIYIFLTLLTTKRVLENYEIWVNVTSNQGSKLQKLCKTSEALEEFDANVAISESIPCNSTYCYSQQDLASDTCFNASRGECLPQ